MPLELDLDDDFDAPALDERRWLPAYLPHWSSRTAAAARYTIADGCLRLRIDEDQPPWCPDLDGDVRVSALQTGAFSGPVGSRIGQHRFHPDAVVREAQPNVRLYTPRYGRVELRARASDDPDAMVALWLIGYEDEPERSAEICVCEIFGRDVGASEARVGMGLHPFGDPRIRDDFTAEPLPVDARELHDYAVEWQPGRSSFFVDGRQVKTVGQAPDYPMQLMLTLYAFPPADAGKASGRWPKEFVVDRVRGFTLDST